MSLPVVVQTAPAPHLERRREVLAEDFSSQDEEEAARLCIVLAQDLVLIEGLLLKLRRAKRVELEVVLKVLKLAPQAGLPAENIRKELSAPLVYVHDTPCLTFPAKSVVSACEKLGNSFDCFRKVILTRSSSAFP